MRLARATAATVSLAWRHGGPDGVTVADEPWRPAPEQLAPARAALGARARVRDNAVTAGPVQLRLAPDGRWYRFDRHGRSWDLTRPPAADPSDLLDLDEGAGPDADDDS